MNGVTTVCVGDIRCLWSDIELNRVGLVGRTKMRMSTNLTIGFLRSVGNIDA